MYDLSSSALSLSLLSLHLQDNDFAIIYLVNIFFQIKKLNAVSEDDLNLSLLLDNNY